MKLSWNACKLPRCPSATPLCCNRLANWSSWALFKWIRGKISICSSGVFHFHQKEKRWRNRHRTASKLNGAKSLRDFSPIVQKKKHLLVKGKQFDSAVKFSYPGGMNSPAISGVCNHLGFAQGPAPMGFIPEASDKDTDLNAIKTQKIMFS